MTENRAQLYGTRFIIGKSFVILIIGDQKIDPSIAAQPSYILPKTPEGSDPSSASGIVLLPATEKLQRLQDHGIQEFAS